VPRHIMQENATMLSIVQEYVSNYFREHIPAEYVFHDIMHTEQVVEGINEIGVELNLSIAEMEMMRIAAWFHDTGYDKGADGHEERSADYAGAFLTKCGYPEERIKMVQGCILATKLPHNPKDMMQKIICDADMSHLGKRSYWERSACIREELRLTKGINMNELEWVDFELNFLLSQRYLTPIGQALYNKRKAKHIKELRKQKLRLDPSEALTVDEIANKGVKEGRKQEEALGLLKEEDEADLRNGRLSRGVETMFRTTYQTHINLSAMADHKANQMLSVNSICISIAGSHLIPKLLGDGAYSGKFLAPVAVIMVTCVASMVYATLATRPKVTEGIVTREAIAQRKSNLLFFGNFHSMKLEDFQWGVMEMIKDPEFLYSTMTRDIYFLGIVLAKKYRYLSFCYNIFMYGLILAIVAFGISFLF
jgi:predicted metal-dependent HD superfamily phosphohydrolase